VNALKTLFHELGHMMLGHATDGADGESPCSRGVGEIQAGLTARGTPPGWTL
jgi:hypothetical protein